MIKGLGFEIIISSDIDYEKLCAEIYFNGEFVAIISQEKGIDKEIIEIYPSKNMSSWSFNLLEFIEILNEAKNKI